MRYALNAAQMKAADRNTIEHFGVASLVLQERAALAVCDRVDAYVRGKPGNSGRKESVRIFAGPGNNGADALACARILSLRGVQTETLLVGDAAKQTEECRAQLRSVRAYGLSVRDFKPEEQEAHIVPALVIDGLLGVGINRAPEGVYDSAVSEINRLRDLGTYVIAIDIPSGLGADDGCVYQNAVMADETVTFGFAKSGLLLNQGIVRCGKLHVAGIGITEESLLAGTDRAVAADACYYGDLSELSLPDRAPDGNKGTFGKVLLVAGSRETGGAAILAAKAALHAGCGMVRAFTEQTNRDAVLQSVPEALVDVYDAGGFAEQSVFSALDRALAWADTVVCGCGIGTGKTAQALLAHLLDTADIPLVLDADALNLLALPGNDLLEKACRFAGKAHGAPLVLTPHAGEFARLYNRAFDREETVADCKRHARTYPALLAAKTGAIVLYKDAASVVSRGEGMFYINVSGNDGMATAGSGDVLAGLLGALLASSGKKDAMETVCDAAFIHGAAGDLAAEKKGKRALCASDLSEALTAVLRGMDERTGKAGFVA